MALAAMATPITMNNACKAKDVVSWIYPGIRLSGATPKLNDKDLALSLPSKAVLPQRNAVIVTMKDLIQKAISHLEQSHFFGFLTGRFLLFLFGSLRNNRIFDSLFQSLSLPFYGEGHFVTLFHSVSTDVCVHF